MLILQWAAIFVVALAVLIKAADFFTDSAEKIGLHFRIPPFIIGVTILALGTSLPELATSVVSVVRGHSEIVIGDVVGSNIANILLVLATASIIAKRMVIDKEILSVDLPYVFGSAILLFLFTLDGKFNYVEGIISVLMLVTYLIYNVVSHRRLDMTHKKELAKEKVKLKKEEKKKKDKLPIKYPIVLLLSGIAIYFSADYTVTSIIKLAELLKIGAEIVAVSAVAIGTSLPELVVSVIAATKGKADIAVGNVLGSNIFNTLGVMGASSFFGVLVIPAGIITFSIPAMILITLLFIFISQDKEITQWEGYTMLLLYVAFMGITFGLI